MSSVTRVGAIVFVLAASPAVRTAAAQSIPPAIETGLKVSIVDDRGPRVDGRVQGVSDQSVRLATRAGIMDIPLAHIVRIERPDTVKNGAISGLVVGLTMGLIGTATYPEGGAVLVTRTLGNGLICAGLGALIDAAVDGRKTLYERNVGPQARIRPVIGRGVTSVAVSIDW